VPRSSAAKVGIRADVLAALGYAIPRRDLKSALRAYTSNAGYLRALSAGVSGSVLMQACGQCHVRFKLTPTDLNER
jgi:sRNA-binding protein